ncbi:MAG: succinate dehydrogenase, cytochrome b556 subunit, partial [Gammaproteobacteria bacterium]|nr:succinate dehydrogenase, cytochrome b556 subunit [Gammaproteobacteria bacterium]
FLNLFRIRFPVAAVTSIAHRISGVLLFLFFPFLVWLLDLSLQGPDSYARALALLQPAWIRLGLALIAWSLLHHLLSGIRFLLIDIDVGVSLRASRRSAWIINIVGILLGLACLGWLF